MQGRTLVAGIAIAIVAALLASGVVAPGTTGAPAAAHPAAKSGGPAASPSTTAPGAAREETVLRELAHSGIPASDIHLPDLSVAPPRPGEAVGPTYSRAPAPMGVADLGLTNVSGELRGSILNSSSVEGTITLTNALSVNVDGDGPDMFGIQLNAVVTGVTLFGNSTNEFWTQNFVSYTPSSGQLVFGDNVWNFSNYAAYISPNVFYANGPNGTLYAPVYYYAIGPTFTIHYPFAITFYENSTVLYDRPAVFFNYTVSNTTMRTSGSYDFVVFNATSSSAPELKQPFPAGAYQINGLQLDPVGLPNDLELSVLGNDDGDTTSFYAMNATAAIATWNSTTGAYVPVPSAMDAGSETGETSDGIAVSYSAGTPVAQLRLGPSFIYGLWGMSATSGSRTVIQKLNPPNTFIMVNPGSAPNESEAQWVPSSPTGTTTFYVPNGGPYWIEYLLSERDPRGLRLDSPANSTTLESLRERFDFARGVYTPLIAFGNAELAGISSGGQGTMGSPYRIDNNEYGLIDPEFAALNDWLWPVFPGLLLFGTTDYVSVTAPSFQIVYPNWVESEYNPAINATVAELGLPAANNLQLWFWNTTHVIVRGGTISGWLSSFLAGFPLGSVIFWNSSDDLVAGVTFEDQGDAIILYGGTNNTIWGNRFYSVPTTASQPENVLNSGNFTQAVNESESGDLIYNNFVDVPFPAITPTYDPLSCQILCEPAVYVDSWNVSLRPANAVSVVDGVALSGNILGLRYQGGNYWSNYGTPSNPYGVLPYNNSGLITVGGDYLPLTFPHHHHRWQFPVFGPQSGPFGPVAPNWLLLSAPGPAAAVREPAGAPRSATPSAAGRPASPALLAADHPSPNR